jgi:hypothetical protein
MANIKDQIAALKVRFDGLQSSLEQQAKSSAELRNVLAKLNGSIDLLVEAEKQLDSLQKGLQLGPR